MQEKFPFDIRLSFFGQDIPDSFIDFVFGGGGVKFNVYLKGIISSFSLIFFYPLLLLI